MPLHERLGRPARASVEPLRPANKAWCARNGTLRDDFGPFFAIVDRLYPDGIPAIQRQEDGSGFANYSSGRKALCTTCFQRSHRVSAIAYASRDFPVVSAVPLSPAAAKSDGEVKAKRSRHLGHLDEWGIGCFESVPDGTGARGSYEVTQTAVIVRSGGQRTTVHRSNEADLKANAQKLQLKLNSELTVSYDVNGGFSVVNFDSNGVQQNFHVGEVWRAPAGHGIAPSTSHHEPEHIIEAISFGTQAKLSTATSLMGGKADSIKRDLKIATGHLKTAEQTLLPSEIAKSSSAPSLPAQGNNKERSAKLLELAKSLCADKVTKQSQWRHEHLMQKSVREKHPTLGVEKVQKLLADRAENEGYMEEDGIHVGLVMPRPQPLSEWNFYHQPASLQPLSSAQLAETIRECDTNGLLLVVLAVADWATGSVYNSCKHARAVCEAALGELRSLDLDKKLKFAVVECTEAGAIHSTTKWEGPLSQYGVQAAPWLLMFSHGQCVTSEKPGCEMFGQGHRALPGVDVVGGLGFAARLRNQPVFAKPRVLVLEPGPSEVIKAGSNQFKLQLETQQMLKQTGLDFTLALTVTDASRLASAGEPAYRILLCSSAVGAGAFADVASRMRQRSSDAVCFVCHDGKSIGPLDQQFRDLGSLVHCVFQRPLSKSAFDKALRPIQAMRVNYPKCGMTKASVVQLIQRKIAG